MQDHIIYDPIGDGVDRRGFLKCMAWGGTGLAWTASGGILGCSQLTKDAPTPPSGDFTFVQLSDSHIGFRHAPNKDVVGTFREAIARINALPERPAFILHTGDLTHWGDAGQFDTVDQILKETKAGEVFCVPGEHDFARDDAKLYLARYGKGTCGDGWRSFDYKGIHFIGLVNALQGEAGGLGVLGRDQLDWLKKDVTRLGDRTPVVVYAHVPLWTVSGEWGWGTEDGTQALSYLRRFGSVTVLNGHIHQTMQKIEGNVTFHAARSTAYPQRAPGTAKFPGPIKDVPADKLRSVLGLTKVKYVEADSSLAIVDSSLASM
jgi:3',5'-cyclic AMP phosphodiesterase CpdA